MREMNLYVRAVLLTLVGLELIAIAMLWVDRIESKRQIAQWREESTRLAAFAGPLLAITDHQSGRLRVYELTTDPGLQKTGRTDGPFEVWPRLYAPTPAGEAIDGTFVETYNAKMREMEAKRQASR